MTQKASELQPIVFVVDDDPSVREGLSSLFRSIGLRVELFASGAEFLKTSPIAAPSCLVLDVRLPGVSGLDFQAELAKVGFHIPIVFITGHGDIPMTVKAMKAGAVEFLTKPFRDQEMLDAVQLAIAKDRARRASENAASELRAVYATLTAREREVMALVAGGRMNKQIAADLGVSEVTVKFHRGHLMRKLGARTPAELVRMADKFGLDQPGS